MTKDDVKNEYPDLCFFLKHIPILESSVIMDCVPLYGIVCESYDYLSYLRELCQNSWG